MTKLTLSFSLLLVTSFGLSSLFFSQALDVPLDRGAVGLVQALDRLPSISRVMFIAAHPDDENSGALPYVSRGLHAKTALLTLTRGEGGQNLIGSEMFEGLGMIRTGELLAADEYYGVEQYFTRAFDFGFSRTSEESFQKWGRETILTDMVRAIRQFRPHIIVSVWSGDPRDGHGHHQACGILAKEAFFAARDGNRFPELAQEGLAPWIVQKLYFRVSKADESSFAINTGQYVPLFGASFQEIAALGYSFHRSQGAGGSYAFPGDFDSFFRLGYPDVPDDSGFFDHLTLKLTDLPLLVEGESQKKQWLVEEMGSVEHMIRDARQNFQPENFSGSVGSLLQGIVKLRKIQETLTQGLGNPGIKASGELLFLLNEKEKDFMKALDLATGLYFEGLAEDSSVTPGESFAVRAIIVNRFSENIELTRVDLKAEKDWHLKLREQGPSRVEPGKKTVFEFSVSVPLDAKPSRVPWKRNSRKDAIYTAAEGPMKWAPVPAPRLAALLEYQLRGVRLSSTRPVQFLDANSLRGTHKVPLLVVPTVSLEVSPPLQLVPLVTSAVHREVQIKVVNNARSFTSGVLKAAPTSEWIVMPEEIPFSLAQKGEANSFKFELISNPGVKPGRYSIEISAIVNGTEINEEYHQISVQDVWRFPIYRKAASEVEVLDLHIPSGLTVAYIKGPGDKVPDTLQQLGIPVKLLGPEDLASGDLSNYSSIVVGVRAYEVRDDLVANNNRLLEYVKAGGTLIVQYQRRSGWNRGSLSPYPAKIQSDGDRVTDETAPVTILEPSHSIFNFPNRITGSDFEGWVQERGLYFFQDRDARFKPLLSMGDPGFPQLDGGLLVADYGKGKYVLTALSWFRQLPEGVPGAIRIFVNLISLGRQSER
jgi:LmbE family N-acetylglucosaminyl deacetylase